MRQGLAWLCVVVGVLVVGITLGRAPAPMDRPALKPGKVAVSKPDPHGLVTMLRPVVTHLNPDDPFRVALHWAPKDRPLERGDVADTWRRQATLRSMTFTLTTPGGKYVLKPDNEQLCMERGWWLHHNPTFVLTLTKDAVFGERGKKWAWAGEKRPDLSRPGVYRLQIKGSLVRVTEKPIPFVSASIALKVSRSVRTQAKALSSAREAMLKQQPGFDMTRAKVSLREDAKGNAIVRFRTFQEANESNEDWTVLVKPDGKAELPSFREVKPLVDDLWYDRWPEYPPRAK